MVRPQGELLELLKHYVCIRIEDLRGVDIGLFSFDPDITMYSFILNGDESIYLRYGGRDDSSPMSYMSRESLIWTLKRGLELHQAYSDGNFQPTPRPPSKFPREFPSIQRDVIAKNQCCHCHHIGSGRTKLLLSQGKFDPMKDLWSYPDIKKLGIEIDINEGLLVANVARAAEKAGMQTGDLITKAEGRAVFTFGDLQEAIHRHPIDAKKLDIQVQRGEEAKSLEVTLHEWWRTTRVNRRSSYNSLEPFPEFWARPMDAKEKQAAGIGDEEFAGEVTKFWVGTRGKAAGLRVGDIVYKVDDISQSPYTDHPPTWIRLNRKAGDRVTVGVLRDGKKLEMSFKLKARPW